MSGSRYLGFNEAAGIHRRKLHENVSALEPSISFNEAAGIHRRKPGSPLSGSIMPSCFNEAAGIHRRKRRENHRRRVARQRGLQ